MGCDGSSWRPEGWSWELEMNILIISYFKKGKSCYYILYSVLRFSIIKDAALHQLRTFQLQQCEHRQTSADRLKVDYELDLFLFSTTAKTPSITGKILSVVI